MYIVALFLWTTGAQAADYCAPLARLAKANNSCVDNEVTFSEAAVLCLKKFDADVNLAGNLMSKNLLGGTRNSAEKVKNQEGYFQGAEKDYAQANLKMAALILDGTRALAQVEEYKNNLAVPEDFENASVMGFTPDSFLASIPCYDDNEKILKTVAQDFRDKIAQLQKAHDVAFSHQDTSKGSKVGIGRDVASMNAPVAGGARGTGPKKFTKGSARNGSSDITGTEKKSEKLEQK
jgi:hypothetical protein